MNGYIFALFVSTSFAFSLSKGVRGNILPSSIFFLLDICNREETLQAASYTLKKTDLQEKIIREKLSAFVDISLFMQTRSEKLSKMTKKKQIL